jgi:Zn-dependent oligopeptidase
MPPIHHIGRWNRLVLPSNTLPSSFKHSQCRSITTYLRDVWRSKSFRPSNPLANTLEEIYGPKPPSNRKISEVDTPITVPANVPRLQHVRPHHVGPAVQSLQTQFLSSNNDSIGEVRKNTAARSLTSTLTTLNENRAVLQSGRQIANWLCHMADERNKGEWHRAAQTVANTIDESSLETSETVYQTLRSLLLVQDEQHGELDFAMSDARFAAQMWVRKYEVETGQSLFEDEEKFIKYREYTEALHGVTAAIQKAPPLATQLLIADMYNYVGLSNAKANLLGYKNWAEQILEHRIVTVEELEGLHETIRERLQPFLKSASGQANNSSGQALDDLLTPTGNTPLVSGLSPQQMDDLSRLRIERHVTLEGALFVASRMSQDVFGVSLIPASPEESLVCGWHEDVRLFHVQDDITGSHLGSFYLDPFARDGKLKRAVSSPLITRGRILENDAERTPVVAVVLSIAPPIWDTDPATLTWMDVEALWHELGHVYQYMLGHSSLGTYLGPEQNLDWLEIVPKFMEHWLMEPSTLLALVHASELGRDLESNVEESIEAAYRHRSRQKVMELAQLTFYGQLELTLFSKFDLKGEESMLDLQHRLAQEFVPHDLPGRKDITALRDIFQDNANGRPLANYRYLYSEIVSAQVFEQWKESYEVDVERLPQLRQSLRRSFLERGAAVKVDDIDPTYQIQNVSPHALFQRYRL